MTCFGITGPPGAGKTSVRLQLAERLSAVSLDIIDFFKAETAFSDEDRWLAYQQMLSEVECALIQQRHVVLEAFLFRPQRLNALREVCDRHDSRLVLVFLTGKSSVLLDRVHGRSKGRFSTDVSDQGIGRFLSEFEGMEADIGIDTSDKSVAEVVDCILKRGSKWTKKA